LRATYNRTTIVSYHRLRLSHASDDSFLGLKARTGASSLRCSASYHPLLKSHSFITNPAMESKRSTQYNQVDKSQRIRLQLRLSCSFSGNVCPPSTWTINSGTGTGNSSALCLLILLRQLYPQLIGHAFTGRLLHREVVRSTFQIIAASVTSGNACSHCSLARSGQTQI